jgi:L-iditol 2-dehydrogenase
VTLGHEFAGTIEATGPGVTLAAGTLIACDPNIACGTCPACLTGRVNLCEALVAIGVHRDGGLADRVVIPAHRAFPLPPGLDPAHGALAEPLSCTLHGVDLAAPGPGQRVTVIGGGVIGLLAVQLAKAAGADVLLVTRHPHKRALAEGFGARTAATPDEALSIWPRGAEAVIEAAGVPATVVMAPRLAARGGRVVILGVLPQGTQVAIEPFDLLVREVSVLTSFLNPFTQSRAVDLIALGLIACEPLISARVDLDRAVRVIRDDPAPGEVKVIAVPG